MTQYWEYQSSNKEQQIVATLWEPEQTPVGIVQILHGMREHMGRYEDFARFLNSAGYVVCGHDYIGHGRTALRWGYYGYFGKSQGAKYLVEDGALLTKILAEKYPNLPLFLLGHSMGSLIGRIEITKVPQLLSGFICMGTLGKNKAAPLFRAFVAGTAKSKGPRANSLIANKMMDTLTGRGMSPAENIDNWLTHDLEQVQRYSEDPHTRFRFTVQGYADLLDLLIAANRSKWYQKVPKNLPILLVSGGQDPISNLAEDLPEIERGLYREQVQDVRCIIYEGMRHEVLNEIDHDIVYQDILDWINDHRIGKTTYEKEMEA